jgi:hypothetical protein
MPVMSALRKSSSLSNDNFSLRRVTLGLPLSVWTQGVLVRLKLDRLPAELSGLD